MYIDLIITHSLEEGEHVLMNIFVLIRNSRESIVGIPTGYSYPN